MTKIQHLTTMHNKFKKTKTLFFSVFVSTSLYSQAQLEEIIVNSKKSSLKEIIEKQNKTIIDEENIKSFPKGNGNINEILKFLPDIKVDNNAETSLNAGEISPENISITGGKFYQNNFLIDGTSNNSLLDPANNNAYQINDVKGHPQEVFLDTDIIKSIEVYDSNVPARFGKFTGGVVNAKTKHAVPKFFGKVQYRHTNDNLTKFFISNEEKFKNSNSSKEQPRFKKDFFNFSVNTPINESSGLYFSSIFKESTIPLLHFKKSKKTKRSSTNVFSKYSKFFEDDSILDLSFIYSPYEEKRFLKNVNNSDFEIKGGGYKTKALYEKSFNKFKLESILDFSFSENSRYSPQHYYNWANSKNKTWGNIIEQTTSREGGYGDIEKNQMILNFKNDFDFSFLKTGFDIGIGKAKFKRKEDSSIYKVSSQEDGNNSFEPESSLFNLECKGRDGCIDEDQYASSKTTYHAFERNVDILNTSSYLEKNFTYNRANLRAGLRYDFNNYMKNHDIAYRTLSSFDIFGNKKTIFNIGFNRYYANSFLTYKLREAKEPYIIYTRGITPTSGGKFTPEDWQISSRQGFNKYSYKDLDTPYSDEKSISLNQDLFAGNLSINLIRRDNKKGFNKNYSTIQPDGYRYYELSNDGKSTHDSLRVSYSKSFDNHFFAINWNKSKTKRTNESYDSEILDDSSSTNSVYYNGKFIPFGNLPRHHDTQPDVLKFVYKYTYKTFSFHTYVNHKTSYRKLSLTDETEPEVTLNKGTGNYSYEDKPIYKIAKYSPITKVDLSLAYGFKMRNKNLLELKTDIKNVFNEKQKISNLNSNYYLGRQFWFELAYKF